MRSRVPSIHVCDKCAFLLHKYMGKVHTFLKNPPEDWMVARGYDKNFVQFTKDCEEWKAALRASCPRNKPNA